MVEPLVAAGLAQHFIEDSADVGHVGLVRFLLGGGYMKWKSREYEAQGQGAILVCFLHHGHV